MTRGLSEGEEVRREGDGEGLEGGGGRREAVVRGERRASVVRTGRARCIARRWPGFMDWDDVDRGLELGKRFGSVEDGFSYRRTTL